MVPPRDQGEESRLNMDDTLYQTMRGERGRYSKRGTTDQERQPRQRDQSSQNGQVLYKDQDGGKEVKPGPWRRGSGGGVRSAVRSHRCPVRLALGLRPNARSWFPFSSPTWQLELSNSSSG